MTDKSDIYAGHENLADMIIGHISTVIYLIQTAKKNSRGEDDEDEGPRGGFSLLCDHEIKAMQEISAACEHELKNKAEISPPVHPSARKVTPR